MNSITEETKQLLDSAHAAIGEVRDHLSLHPEIFDKESRDFIALKAGRINDLTTEMITLANKDI